MKKFIYLVCMMSFIVMSCQEKVNVPLSKDGSIPEMVKDIKVENLPGAAKIYFTQPKDPNFLYTEVVYEIREGEERVVKSSKFSNFLLVEGFSEESEYTLNLYTVSKAEKRSAPQQVIIHPEKAPIHSVAESFNVVPTFGGILYNVTNPMEIELVIYTLIKDDDGNWNEFERFYSGAQNIEHAVRDLDSSLYDFGFYLQDEWGNNSDTIYETLKPLYEEELDKSLWDNAELEDDFDYPLYSPLYQLWTPGDKTYFFQDYRDYPELAVLPSWVTIDLGKEYVLGRMKLFMVKHAINWQYNSCSIKEFEIWGSNTPTTNWNDWTMLGHFESTRPSGRSIGEPLTDDDLKQLESGEDFTFPLMNESYRYIRLKVLRTYGNQSYFCSLELSFWGASK